MLDSTLVVLATGSVASLSSTEMVEAIINLLLFGARGGGVKRGFVYGSSDKEGAYPENPVTVNDTQPLDGLRACRLRKSFTRDEASFVVRVKAKPVHGIFT